MNTNGGNLRRVFTHNSGLRKREKVKRLSEETMSSNAEDNLHRRKFKGLCDSIPVHPASVPRKLRSAISKRSPRSASVPTMDSKRLKHSINGGVASLRADYLKKIKANMQYVSEPLSKEEEEVAETLFALAGMITSDGESSKAKTPECTGNHDDPMSSSKDVVIRKEEPETACNQSTSNADAVPIGDGPERDSILGKATSGTSPINWPNLSEKRQLNQALNVSAHPQRMPPLRACDEKVVVNCCTSSQLSNDAIRHTSVSDSKTEKTSFTLLQSQHFVDSQAVDKVSSHERSSATVFPSWANAPASSSRSDACGNKLATDKVSSCVNGSMESRKRSMTHVFISHLIQGLETSTGKDNQPLNACQLLPSQSSSIPPNNNDLNGALTTHMVGSTTYENMCETGDRVPIVLEHHEGEEDGLMKKNFTFLSLTRGVGLQANSEAKGQVSHLHSVSQASASLPGSTSTTCLTSKAYLDQAAVGSLAMPRVLPQMQLQMPQYFAGTFNAAHMSQTGTGKPAQIAQPNLQQQNLQQQQVQLPRQQQLQLPQQHQHQHQHQHLQQQQLQFPPPQQHLQQQPLQLPQLQQQHNRNLHSQQLQLQHPQHHQQQQQQQKWTSQLPAQFRPGPLLPSHIQNWQNHKQDFRISTQAWPTSCQPSREMSGPKFFHIPQHSRQLIERCPPVPLSSTKPQPGQLPAVCENKGGRFQPDGALPFQLLCNKQ